ncbi:MAG: thrombospondin type 3 repeat-containing protein [Myxococcales bacterium]|nr:thrombospondin type 3 repeat-containing protein [Myxococcales bacterium]
MLRDTSAMSQVMWGPACALGLLLGASCGFEGQGVEPPDPGQDHDGDGVGDRADGCPHLATEQQLDQDLDGIGDECDPDNLVPHRRVLFEGFYEAPSSELWEVAGQGSLADWTQVLVGGRSYVRQSSTAGDLRQLRLKAAVPRAIVETRVLVESAPGLGLLSVGLLAADRTTYGLCAARRGALTSPGDQVAAGFYRRDGQTDTESTASWTGPLVSGAIRIRGQHTVAGRSELVCHFAHSEGASISAMAGSSDVDPAGRVGLHTLGISASFDYLFVIAPQ